MIDYVQLLKRHDDSRHAYEPPDFVFAAAEVRFTKMADEITRAFPGSRFETGYDIQDASFLGQIYVAVGIRFALVRVSNFGRFVAFCGSDDDCLSTDARDRLLAIFVAHDYTFIPSDVLAIPYDGDNPGVDGFTTWRHRYFDWI